MQAKPARRKLRFVVRNGNGCWLLRNCMQTRPLWAQAVESLGHHTDFEWKPTSDNFDYSAMTASPKGQRVRCFNHFQNHTVISNKAHLYRTLTEPSPLFTRPDILPPTYCFDSKSASFGQDLVDFVDQFKSKSAELGPVFNQGHNIWMVKPTGYARGCGLELVKNRQELLAVVQAYLTGYRMCDFGKCQNDERKVQSLHKDRLRGMAAGNLGALGVEVEPTRRAKLSLVTMEFPAVLHRQLAHSPHVREAVRYKKALVSRR